MRAILTKQDFDFSEAALYRKIEPLAKSRVRRADKIETIISYHSKHKETENVAQIGDYIIEASRHGGAYIIRQHDFDTLYEENPYDRAYYMAKGARTAIMVMHDCTIMTPWDDMQHILAGGMVIESGDHIYGVDRFSFMQNYARADESGSCYIRMNEPLPIQYRESRSRGLKNHLHDILLREANPHFFM